MTVLARSALRGRGGGSGRAPVTLLAHRYAAVVIATVQLVWLWWVYARGWFLQADLSNMSEAVGRRLDWAYLTHNLGGHFAPVDRVVYWLQNELAPLDYGPAVALRLIAQFAATVLLYRLLCKLTDERSVVTAIVAVYAFNPMLVSGTAMFTPGIGVTLGQLAVIGALLAHVRYDSTRQLQHAFAAGLLLALAMMCSEQWAIAVLALPLVSLLRTYPGGLRQRLLEIVRRWRGWLVSAAPPVLVAIAAVHYVVPVGARAIGVGDLWRLLRESWLKSLAPSLIGGPFRWAADSYTYFAFSAPFDAVVIVSQLGFVALVVLGLRRRGPISLLGWLLPLACWIASTLLVGYRGYAQFGVIVAWTPRYFSALIVFVAIGATLALTGPRVEQAEPAHAAPGSPESGSPGSESSVDQPVSRPALAVPASALVCIALLITACVVSGLRYATLLGRQQAETWVSNLRSSAQLRGPNVNVYDTPVPAWLISNIEPHHRVSDLLRLAGVNDAVYESPSSTPLVAGRDGRLVPSVFVAAASVVTSNPGCGSAVRGQGTFTFPLNHATSDAEWWLRLTLFEQEPTAVGVHLVGAFGQIASPVSGSRVSLTRLESVSLRLPRFPVVAVQITTSSPDASLCLTSIEVGAPFPAPGS